MKLAVKIPRAAWIGLGAAGLVLYVAFILAPSAKDLHRQIGRIRACAGKLQAFQKEEARLKAAAGKIEEMRASVGAFESRLPARAALEDLLESLSMLATAAGSRITAVRPAFEVLTDEKVPKVASAFYEPYPIRVEVRGGTHELGRFLAAVEGGKTFFRVIEISVEEDSDDEFRPIAKCLMFTELLPESSSP